MSVGADRHPGDGRETVHRPASRPGPLPKEARAAGEPEGGITLIIDGDRVRVPERVTVAAALLNHGVWRFRRSVSGEPRAPLCGMGSCHECLVTIDGVRHRRACMTWARTGMEIRTGD